jgi:hypothetical protein
VRLSTILCVITITAAPAAEPALAPVSVCEVLQNPAKYSGQTALVLGRFSFRGQGRFLSEHACDIKEAAGKDPWPDVLRVIVDTKTGPKPPDRLAVDSALLDTKVEALKHSNTLATFRFGSTDYDRWGLVYGRIELSPDYAAGPPKDAKKSEFDPAPGKIVCRGEALIVFIGER